MIPLEDEFGVCRIPHDFHWRLARRWRKYIQRTERHISEQSKASVLIVCVWNQFSKVAYNIKGIVQNENSVIVYSHSFLCNPYEFTAFIDMWALINTHHQIWQMETWPCLLDIQGYCASRKYVWVSVYHIWRAPCMCIDQWLNVNKSQDLD